MIFSDVAFSKLDDKAGYGFAIWLNGSFVAVGSLDGSKVSSSKVVKSMDILSVLIEAKPRGFSKVHILTDGLEVVRAIKEPEMSSNSRRLWRRPVQRCGNAPSQATGSKFGDGDPGRTLFSGFCKRR
ncbi:hypothetical protein MRB53_026431 [Persea americana]|uniref:Uncharacterized protein n=1 Tax=Persea americana TaxID=3435 RepID=A0ACC2LIJ5_PERAE|nr:hypothetical protein MRB53_026431 [Persea americana]